MGDIETVKAVITGQEIKNPQALTEDDTAKAYRLLVMLYKMSIKEIGSYQFKD